MKKMYVLGLLLSITSLLESFDKKIVVSLAPWRTAVFIRVTEKTTYKSLLKAIQDRTSKMEIKKITGIKETKDKKTDLSKLSKKEFTEKLRTLEKLYVTYKKYYLF